MEKNLTHLQIIDLLKREKSFLKNEFGVINIGLFGSYTREKQGVGSDIDILVELKEPRFDWLVGLQLYLEQKLDKKIDVIRKSKTLRSRFVERIEKSVIYA
ncbi:MAG: nucleotidyltransferase domain-containing protein [Thermodesulfobacteriota bacterium]|nr:nucleotidyltransferase domain-containing protein [Thermodesulfobacteriota bacterium]